MASPLLFLTPFRSESASAIAKSVIDAIDVYRDTYDEEAYDLNDLKIRQKDKCAPCTSIWIGGTCGAGRWISRRFAPDLAHCFVDVAV